MTGPEKKLTTSEVFALFCADDSREPLSAPEVGDQFDVSRTTARRRLGELLQQDKLAQKQIGQADVYWLPATPPIERADPLLSDH